MPNTLQPVYPSDIIGQRITLLIPDNLNIPNIYKGEEYNVDLHPFTNNPDNIQVRYQVISGPGYIKDEHYYHISRDVLLPGTHKVIIRQYSQINDSESEFDLIVQNKNYNPTINLIDREMYAGDTLRINLLEYASDFDIDNINFVLVSNNPELNDAIIHGNTYVQKPAFNLIHPDNDLGRQFNITIELRDEYDYTIASDTFTLTVKYLDSVPTKPVNLRPNNSQKINTKIINFYWDKSRSNLQNDIIVYDVYLSEDNQNWISIIKNTGLTKFEYIPETPLLSNHTYYWYVAQKNSKNIDVNSDIVIFTTQKNIQESVYYDILSLMD